MRLMDGEHVGPFNLGNPGEFTMLELAEVQLPHPLGWLTLVSHLVTPSGYFLGWLTVVIHLG